MIAEACKYVLLLLGSAVFCVVAEQPSEWESSPVRSCASLSLAIPGRGAAYRGSLQNDDYGLTMVLPSGLTGWGAADIAPFHGFTVFLPDGGKVGACLIFEIHRHVEFGGSVAKQRVQGQAAKVGNIESSRRERTGRLDGVALRNVLVEFSASHGSARYDGQVWLVTPMNMVARNEAVLSAFLSQIHFK